jgi:hypothetical protein
MKPDPGTLDRLLELARQGRRITSATTAHNGRAEAEPLTPSPGWTTRIAARWASGAVARGPNATDLWERLAWTGCAAAVAVCLVALALHPEPPPPSCVDLLLGLPQTEALL